MTFVDSFVSCVIGFWYEYVAYITHEEMKGFCQYAQTTGIVILLSPVICAVGFSALVALKKISLFLTRRGPLVPTVSSTQLHRMASGRQLLFVELFTDNCGACDVAGATFEELAITQAGNSNFVKFNISRPGIDGIRNRFAMRAEHTHHFYVAVQNGKVIDRLNASDPHQLPFSVRRAVDDSEPEIGITPLYRTVIAGILIITLFIFTFCVGGFLGCMSAHLHASEEAKMEELAPPAAPSINLRALGDMGGQTVTIEKIEEVPLSKRGSYVTMGERGTLEVPKYAVSQPDSDLEVHELTTAEVAVKKRRAEECPKVNRMESPVALVDDPVTTAEIDGKRRAEECSEVYRMKSPVALVDEPTSVNTPFPSQSAASVVGLAGAEEVGVLQEIEWKHEGDEVAVRGTFSHWKPQPMQRLEKGSFTFSFPVIKGTVYMFNFMVDGALRTDPDRETMKFYVGDTEEDVHTLYGMD